MRAVPGIPSPSKKPSLVISSWVAGEEPGCFSACSSGEESGREREREKCSTLADRFPFSNGWPTQGYSACPVLPGSALKHCAALSSSCRCGADCERGREEKQRSEGERYEWVEGSVWCVWMSEYMWTHSNVNKAETLGVPHHIWSASSRAFCLFTALTHWAREYQWAHMGLSPTQLK